MNSALEIIGIVGVGRRIRQHYIKKRLEIKITSIYITCPPSIGLIPLENCGTIQHSTGEGRQIKTDTGLNGK
jgi:hypothetical protein